MKITPEQENLIKDNYGKIPLTEIHKKYFPDTKYITLSSHVRYKMGLVHPKKLWSNDEINLIIKWYEISEGVDLLDMFLPDRSRMSIAAKAQDLGLIRRKRWAEKELEYLKENYKFTKNKDLVKSLDKTDAQIAIKRKELGLIKDISVQSHKKYSHNEQYFENLNLLNCFTGGRIGTDGCIQDKNRGSLAMDYTVARIDEVIIDDLIRDFQYTGVKQYGQKWNESKTIRTELVGVSINCFDKCAADLEKHFNITPRKSLTLKGPNINDDILALSYFIGAVDGDGTVTVSKRKSKRKSGGYNYYPYISICGASLSFIEWCRDLMDRNFGHKFRKNSSNIQTDYKEGDDGEIRICYKYTIEGNRAAIIIDFLRHFPVPKLERKWSNPEVLQKIEEYKQKFPQYFNKSLPDFTKYINISQNSNSQSQIPPVNT